MMSKRWGVIVSPVRANVRGRMVLLWYSVDE